MVGEAGLSHGSGRPNSTDGNVDYCRRIVDLIRQFSGEREGREDMDAGPRLMKRAAMLLMVVARRQPPLFSKV